MAMHENQELLQCMYLHHPHHLRNPTCNLYDLTGYFRDLMPAVAFFLELIQGINRVEGGKKYKSNPIYQYLNNIVLSYEKSPHLGTDSRI